MNNKDTPPIRRFKTQRPLRRLLKTLAAVRETHKHYSSPSQSSEGKAICKACNELILQILAKITTIISSSE